jgi:DNA polymerase III subunit beta
MQIRLKAQSLNLIATRLWGALGEKSLSYVALKAQGSTLRAQATDRILSIFCNQECNTISPGECFIPGKIFCSLIKELPNTEIELQTQGSYLQIKTLQDHQFFMKIPRIKGLEWQPVPQENEKEEQSSEIATTSLAYILEQIKFCVQSESQRGYGTVAYLHRTGPESIRLVGSDGFRLSYGETQGSFPPKFLKQGVCISKKALDEILKLTQEPVEILTLSVLQKGALLKVKAKCSTLYVLLSNIRYPLYQTVIPEKTQNKAIISRNKLQSILRRILLASDKTKTLQLKFSPQNLMLKAHTQGETEGREILTLEEYNGSSCLLSVNGKYLLDIIASCASSSNVTINFSDKNESISIVPADEPLGCRSLHVLVPIHEEELESTQL